MKKIVAFATVGTLGFFVGGLWACIRICEMVDAGIDVNSIAKDCIRAGAAESASGGGSILKSPGNY